MSAAPESNKWRVSNSLKWSHRGFFFFFFLRESHFQVPEKLTGSSPKRFQWFCKEISIENFQREGPRSRTFIWKFIPRKLLTDPPNTPYARPQFVVGIQMTELLIIISINGIIRRMVCNNNNNPYDKIPTRHI